MDESEVVKDVLDEPEDVKDVLDNPEVVEDVMGDVLDEPEVVEDVMGDVLDEPEAVEDDKGDVTDELGAVKDVEPIEGVLGDVSGDVVLGTDAKDAIEIWLVLEGENQFGAVSLARVGWGESVCPYRRRPTTPG